MIPSFNRQKWILLLGDMALILLATSLASIIRLGQALSILDVHTGASTFTLFLYIIMIYVFDLYNLNRNFWTRDSLFRAALAVIVAGFWGAFIFYSLPHWKYGRGIFLIQMVLVFIFLFGWRFIFSLLYRVSVERENVLVLGAGRCGTALYHLLEGSTAPYKIVGFLDDDPEKRDKSIGSHVVLGPTDRLMEIATQKGVKTAILAITHDRSSQLINRILEARLNGMKILDMPRVYEALTRRIPVKHIQDEWLLFADGFFLLTKEYIQKIKRLIDFGLSSFILLITSPVIAITALAIRLDSSGPVFFRQERVGKDGNIFTLWKFRSMYENAECNGAVWAEKNDSRITRVGKWIRLLRIDEIPQLWNVFRGEMSLIGPRPERPEFVKELEKQIPYYSTRHAVRPGITGWAQVNYPYGASVEDALIKLEYDLYYIKNMSILLDIKIMLKTIGVVLLGTGAR